MRRVSIEQVFRAGWSAGRHSDDHPTAAAAQDRDWRAYAASIHMMGYPSGKSDKGSK